MIQDLYSVEKEIKGKDFSNEKIYKFRQKESKPVIDRIKTWLLENEPKYPPRCKMGEAINYTLSLWNNLILYLEDGRLLINNNLVENAIRPFVIGRKNWLFSYAVSGAKSSAAIYSLIETAKANNRDPYKYLKILFEKLPSAKTDEDYEKLLPYYESSLF